jgi:long-chain acyl-CoA synthetase
MANLRKDGTYTHGCYDKLVFGKMKAILGGNVKIMLTGSAPMAAEVIDFIKICFCAPLHEGYGLTESAAAASITFGKDKNSGFVGGPLACVKFRTRDIPEMDYYSTDKLPRGELQMYGPSIFKGYFMNPEKTKEAFDEDGWFCTGDVVVVTDQGSVKIIDRAKNIFKLSQGEYIAPEKLENVYVQSGLIAQNFVYGDSL